MSDTPRTDEQPTVELWNGEGVEETRQYVERAWANQLEIELAAKQTELDCANDKLEHLRINGLFMGELCHDYESVLPPHRHPGSSGDWFNRTKQLRDMHQDEKARMDDVLKHGFVRWLAQGPYHGKLLMTRAMIDEARNTLYR